MHYRDNSANIVFVTIAIVNLILLYLIYNTEYFVEICCAFIINNIPQRW